MPFENEFASYEPLRRIRESERIKALEDRLEIIRNTDNEPEKLANKIISKEQLESTDWQPDWIIAIDGSLHEVPAEKNKFPNAEYGYITVASVLINLADVRKLEQEEFIDPKAFRETEHTASIETVIPGCNIIVDKDDSPKESMRKILYEELKRSSVFDDGETLLQTYEYLLHIKLDKKPQSPAKCPYYGDCGNDLIYGDGEYQCSCEKKRKLYSTDAMRLHELFNEKGSNGELYGQIMSTLERLWLIHILRAIKTEYKADLRRMVFILDGPLAVFSTSSWLTKSIIEELSNINKEQKKVNPVDILILGIEKSGTFVKYFEDIDNFSENDGTVIEHFPKQSALLLDDTYIKENIIFSKSDKLYGLDTYFGRKFFYKTQGGHRLVATVAFLSPEQQDIKTAYPNQFVRLADIMELLDTVASVQHPNAISPLISAHAEAAIPLNLGKRILEQIASEIRRQ